MVYRSSVMGDKLYIACGWSDLTRSDNNDLWRFDLITYTWESLSLGGYPLTTRSELVFRGYNSTSALLFGGWGKTITNDLYHMNYATNEIVQLRPPTAVLDSRFDHVAVVISSQYMLVYGGTSASNDILSDLWQFYIPTSTWTRLEVVGTTPGPRTQSAAVALGEQVILFGGIGGLNPDTAPIYGDTWRFSFYSKQWQQITVASTVIPEARFAHTMTVYRDDYYLFGGRNQVLYFNDLWRFTVNTAVWVQIQPIGGLPTARIRAQLRLLYNPVGILCLS
eukprot:TRINITY_DN8893_c0_g6_i1.p1 TRINITY_DN8893_c0_g6~~TRINITY_DN8893_c0_g6_i1.p1  ORF type:complete len:279 (+),score=51.08 TRINITY_DN8893_c0_g6_i1:30-866(+)